MVTPSGSTGLYQLCWSTNGVLLWAAWCRSKAKNCGWKFLKCVFRSFKFSSTLSQYGSVEMGLFGEQYGAAVSLDIDGTEF